MNDRRASPFLGQNQILGNSPAAVAAPVSFNDNKTPRGGAQFSRYYAGARGMHCTRATCATPKAS